MQRLKSNIEQLEPELMGAELGIAILTPKDRKNADKLLEAALKCTRPLDTTTIVLGSLLHEIKTKHLYRRWGYENFKDFVDEKIPDCGSRKASYLVSIHEFIKRNKGVIKDEILDEIGWTKLKEIVSIMRNGAPAKQWLEKARAMSKTELLDEVRKFKKTDPNQQEAAIKKLPYNIEKGDREIIVESLDDIRD